MPFAAIYVPDFSVAAMVRANPELQQRAVAVVEGTPPLLNVVATNERAHAAGVEAGMTELEAKGRLASLEVRRRSPLQEAAAHAALLDCACAFSPRVEDTASGTVLLDVTGLERLFGPATRIARQLACRASELGLDANVAVAANAETATHAARGFAGITVIPSGKEAERLGPLSVEVLSPSSEMLETLNRWGVRTCRALAALPEVAVAERLGTAGVELQKLARGGGGRPLVPAEPPLKFEEAVEFDYPVELLEPLAFILNRMLEQLCARLSARALSACELRLRMEYEHPPQSHRDTEKEEISRRSMRMDADQFTNQEITNYKSQITNPYELTLRLPLPMCNAKVFLKLLQLELQAKPPQAPVKKVFLAATPVQPRFAQGGLFMPAAPEPERLELTIARIRAVTSHQSLVARVVSKNNDADGRSPDHPITPSPDEFVGSPELLDTHRPDAFRMRRFEPPADITPDGFPTLFAKRKGGGVSASAKTAPGTPIMALRRFRPPVGVFVELHDGKPSRVRAAPPGLTSGMPAIPGLTPWANPNVAPAGLGTSQRTQNRDSVGHPESVSIRNQQSEIGNIIWASGPWHTSGAWWRTDAWTREEWDVAVNQEDTTALYRIYREIGSGEWFVEASYD